MKELLAGPCSIYKPTLTPRKGLPDAHQGFVPKNSCLQLGCYHFENFFAHLAARWHAFCNRRLSLHQSSGIASRSRVPGATPPTGKWETGGPRRESGSLANAWQGAQFSPRYGELSPSREVAKLKGKKGLGWHPRRANRGLFALNSKSRQNRAPQLDIFLSSQSPHSVESWLSTNSHRALAGRINSPCRRSHARKILRAISCGSSKLTLAPPPGRPAADGIFPPA